MPVRIIVHSDRPRPRIVRPESNPMWINKAKRIAFVALPRTGSREVGYEILKHRGFERWLGHHGVPWGGDNPRHATMQRSGDLFWWFSESLLEWTFYAAHRNHFEVFHSIGHAALGSRPPSRQRFEEYLWKHPALYRNLHILFPAFFEIAGCRELRFDHLRYDVNKMLIAHDLPPLKDVEGHRRLSVHQTNAKPRDEHYSEYLPVDVRHWIEDTYRAEMERYGYRWEEKPGGTVVPPGEGEREG